MLSARIGAAGTVDDVVVTDKVVGASIATDKVVSATLGVFFADFAVFFPDVTLDGLFSGGKL